MLQILLPVLLALPQDTAAPRLTVGFEVDVTRPRSGRIDVEMTVSPVTTDSFRVAMPAWAPGAYRIVNYARAVRDLGARGPDGAALEVKAVDEQTWEVRSGKAGTVTVTYGLEVEDSRMDGEHCYLAGPDTYLYVVGGKDAPCRVRFRRPDGWRVATGLDREGDLYRGRDYDTFIDCPTELGTFELLAFEEDGTRYEVVIHAEGPVDGDKIADMCRRIVRDQNRMFGGTPPFDRYVFLYHFDHRTGGRGLEHLNSTDISMPYRVMKIEPLIAASVTSHEYFHAWNVKRIRPFALGPFDYTQPVPVKSLWFCEGVTSYFGDRTLHRTGIWNEKIYLLHLAREIMALQNNPDRKVTSVEKASWTVWTRKDYPRVDYYNKGELLGLLIDLRMRTETKGARTLDDVMRHLYEEYCVKPAAAGKGPIGVGFPEGGILEAVEEVSGGQWDGFFDRYIRGVEELPYREILEPAGLDVKLTVRRYPGFGISLRGSRVRGVPPGSAAARAGLAVGDTIVSIGGRAVRGRAVAREILKLKVGDEVTVGVRGDGPDTREVTLPVLELRQAQCSLSRSADPSPLQRRLLDGWLKGIREY